jgi:hypothetical protein
LGALADIDNIQIDHRVVSGDPFFCHLFHNAAVFFTLLSIDKVELQRLNMIVGHLRSNPA